MNISEVIQNINSKERTIGLLHRKGKDLAAGIKADRANPPEQITASGEIDYAAIAFSDSAPEYRCTREFRPDTVESAQDIKYILVEDIFNDPFTWELLSNESKTMFLSLTTNDIDIIDLGKIFSYLSKIVIAAKMWLKSDDYETCPVDIVKAQECLTNLIPIKQALSELIIQKPFI